jgi:hypothetical protein
MKQIIKGKNLTLVFVLICITAFGIIVPGCQQEYENIDNNPEITTSSELEDYIIAASDLHQSLKNFENELANINFSNLETVTENGRKVTYLPVSLRSLNIEKKAALLNRKKENLVNKYPQVRLQNFNDFTRIVNHCIEQSIRINDSFLDKNINFYRPRTRAVVGEYSFDSQNALVGCLYNWVLSPDYVEVSIYLFTDGTNLVILDDRNTVGSSIIAFDAGGSYGNYYYNGKQISSVVHTHMSSNIPSDSDYALKNKYQGIGHAIYYNGAFYYY